MLQPSNALQSAETYLPYFNGESQQKREYLSWRICGYSRLESRKNSGYGKATIDRWSRQDPEFAKLEAQGVMEISRQFRSEVIGLEITRNFKGLLSIDRKIIEKKQRGGVLTDEEWDYLKKIRPLYTPQALKQVEELINGMGSNIGSWDEMLVILRKNNAQYNNSEVGYEEQRTTIEASSWAEKSS